MTTGAPVCNPKNVPSLVDENGQFWPISVFKKKYYEGQISKQELVKELEAQYELFEKMCGKADYWNTHENSALHLKAFYVFAEVAKRHNIDATRTFQRVYFDKVDLGLKREIREFLVKNFFEVWFSWIRREFKMPTARVVSFDKRSKLDGDYLLEALKKDGRDYIEVVVHPATSAEHPFFGNISQKRVEEYQFVTSKRIKERYHENDIEFVNFSKL